MEQIIRRDTYLRRIRDKKHNGMIKVITGLRRCGKSFLLFRLFYESLLADGVPADHIICLALDDEQYAAYRDPAQLSAYLRSCIRDGEMYYILLDEVQYAISRAEMKTGGEVRLYGVLNGLLRLRNVDVYVTGSNSRLLTRDVLTAFRGRGDEVRIYPLSFREFYAYVGGDKADAYEEYAFYGGMPLVLFRRTDADKTAYLQRLFEETYFRDIAERYDIALPEVLAELTDALCSSVGSLTNVNKLVNTLRTVKKLDVTNPTLSSYLSYLTDSFLFQNAKRYDVRGKRYFEYPSKYYCTDIGLRNARLNFRQQEETHIMENIIFNTLLQRGYTVDVGVVELNRTEGGSRTQRQCEIDFVAGMGSKRYYIQSAWSVSDPEKMQTELRPLLNTGDFFRKVLISRYSGKPWTDDQGILHLSLLDFLLDEEALSL